MPLHLQEAAQSPVPLCIAEHAARGDHAVGLNENKEVTMANVKLGTKAVGSIVKIKVNGASKDFIVVQQGNPNTSTYDSSCNGTWLLMKDIYTTSTFGDNNSYKDSSIHTYLNGTFYNLIDSNIRAAIKQVKIPYQNGTGSGGSLATGLQRPEHQSVPAVWL